MYHIENHLGHQLGTIYYTGKKPLKDGTLVSDFCWDRNKAMLFDSYEEATKARDDWGGTSRVIVHY